MYFCTCWESKREKAINLPYFFYYWICTNAINLFFSLFSQWYRQCFLLGIIFGLIWSKPDSRHSLQPLICRSVFTLIRKILTLQKWFNILVTFRRDITHKCAPKSTEIHLVVYKAYSGVIILHICYITLLVLLASLVLTTRRYPRLSTQYS